MNWGKIIAVWPWLVAVVGLSMLACAGFWWPAKNVVQKERVVYRDRVVYPPGLIQSYTRNGILFFEDREHGCVWVIGPNQGLVLIRAQTAYCYEFKR